MHADISATRPGVLAGTGGMTQTCQVSGYPDMNTGNTANGHLDSLQNTDGFLFDPESWTMVIASEITRQDGLPGLANDHRVSRR
jgi:hypothetical protein